MPVIIINDSSNPKEIALKSFGDNFFKAIQTVIKLKISFQIKNSEKKEKTQGVYPLYH